MLPVGMLHVISMRGGVNAELANTATATPEAGKDDVDG
jgi:hypothetical protein